MTSEVGLTIQSHRSACVQCGKTKAAHAPEKLKACSRCKAVKYCSVECQKEHWSIHKSGCPVYGQIHDNPAHIIRRCFDLAGLAFVYVHPSLTRNTEDYSIHIWQMPSDVWLLESVAQLSETNKPGDIIMDCIGRLARSLSAEFHNGTLVQAHLNVSRMWVHVEQPDKEIAETIRLYGTHPRNEQTKQRYATLGNFSYKFAQLLNTFAAAYDDFYKPGQVVVFFSHCRIREDLGSYKAGEDILAIDVDISSGRARLLGKRGSELVQLAPAVEEIEVKKPGDVL